MFFFDHDRRAELFPRSLLSPELSDAQHAIVRYLALDERERAQTDIPPVWKAPLGQDVHEALDSLSFGRCPFCERLGLTLLPYRFRPPAYAYGRSNRPDKSNYLWLAFTWENFFPICADCVPVRKDFFPVRGERSPVPALQERWFNPLLPILENEDPILYFPGHRRAVANFTVRLDGHLSGNRKAAQTIEHFNLNRSELVYGRRDAFEATINGLRQRHFTWPEGLLQSSLKAEFGGANFALLRRVAEILRSQLDGPSTLNRNNIEGVFETWFRDPRFEESLDTALAALDREDRGEPATQDHLAVPLPPPVPIERSLPRITRVEVENFKSLESIAIDFAASANGGRMPAAISKSPGTPCLLLLGENSTGKSSFLEAVALACLNDDLRNRLGQKPSDVLLNPEYMGEQSGRIVQHGAIVVQFDNGTSNRLVIDRRMTDLQVEREDVATENVPVFAYGAHRMFGDRDTDDPLSHIHTLFDKRLHLSDPEKWLRELYAQNPAALDEVVSALRHIIQIDGEFSHIEIRDGRCFINIKRTNSQGVAYTVPQRLDIASSGYQAIFALVCDVLRGLFSRTASPRDARNIHALVLIDEIEAHLHPRWKLQIITGLRKALPKTTFVFTSHDPLCVRGMQNGEVVMLNRYLQAGTAEQQREKVECANDFGNIQTLTVEQLLTSEMFQLYSTDDRETDLTFGRVAYLLAKEANLEVLAGEDQAVLTRFRQEIADALPFGTTDVTRLVHEAIAEYLRDRRSARRADQDAARVRAKRQIKDYLRDTLP